MPDLRPSDLAGTAMARKVSAVKTAKSAMKKIKDLFFFLLLAQQFTQVQGTPLTRSYSYLQNELRLSFFRHSEIFTS